MDDNAGVVGTAAVAPESKEPLSMLVDRHWRKLGSLGVERGVPPLVDLWKTMWLFEQAGRGVDGNGEEELSHAMGRIQGVYSGEAIRPGAVLSTAPRVAVLNNGFVAGAEALLERMGVVYAVVDPFFDPESAGLASRVLRPWNCTCATSAAKTPIRWSGRCRSCGPPTRPGPILRKWMYPTARISR